MDFLNPMQTCSHSHTVLQIIPVVHLQSYYHGNSVTCTDRQQQSRHTVNSKTHSHIHAQTQMQDSPDDDDSSVPLPEPAVIQIIISCYLS